MGTPAFSEAKLPGAMALLAGSVPDVLLPPEASVAALEKPPALLSDHSTRRLRRRHVASSSLATRAAGAAGLLASAAAIVAARARHRRRAARLLAASLRRQLGLLPCGGAEDVAEKAADVSQQPTEESRNASVCEGGAEALRVMQTDHSSWLQLACDAGKEGLICGPGAGAKEEAAALASPQLLDGSP
eukprot:TRINITY_DN85830_c0_g1_i1.p1 TRINITY_DN85830_c0_g1~~TRINITY_DN85830_c0_g1_i1.p1  ORF type:complete len:188 (-),score=41.06 TRINITY_DN85830_c0_g1_i1:12-575(-)